MSAPRDEAPRRPGSGRLEARVAGDRAEDPEGQDSKSDSPPAAASAPPGAAPQRRNVVRRLYDWVLSFEKTPYAVPALAVLAFAESSFFPIPPDVLLIALAVAEPKRAFRFAAVASVFSVLGGAAGYAIGLGLWQAIDEFVFRWIPGFTPELYDKVRGLYDEHNFWIVFTAAFTPIPYKVFTIVAGATGIAFVPFLVASAVGRSGRFFLVAGLLFFFGAPIQRFIDRYFNLLSILLAAGVVLGFVAVRFLF